MPRKKKPSARELLAAMRAASRATGQTAIYDGAQIRTEALPLHKCHDGRMVPLRPGVRCADCGFQGE